MNYTGNPVSKADSSINSTQALLVMDMYMYILCDIVHEQLTYLVGVRIHSVLSLCCAKVFPLGLLSVDMMYNMYVGPFQTILCS